MHPPDAPRPGPRTDRPHPHAHIIMKMRGREKEQKLRFKKQDLFELRQAFAEAAREQRVPLAGVLRGIEVSRDDGTLAEVVKN